MIPNPIIARDISFDMIKSLEPGDRVIALMNIVERPFLLQEAYTSYFVKTVHKEGLNKKKTLVEFVRVMIVDGKVKENPKYKALCTELSKLGVRLVECTPEVLAPYKFPGDIIARIRGASETDVICLVGDRDPETPVDSYTAKLFFGGEAAETYISKLRALVSQLS